MQSFADFKFIEMQSDVAKVQLLSWDEDGIIRICWDRDKVLFEKLCFVVVVSSNFVCFAIHYFRGKIFYLQAVQVLESSLTIFSSKKIVVPHVPFCSSRHLASRRITGREILVDIFCWLYLAVDSLYQTGKVNGLPERSRGKTFVLTQARERSDWALQKICYLLQTIQVPYLERKWSHNSDSFGLNSWLDAFGHFKLLSYRLVFFLQNVLVHGHNWKVPILNPDQAANKISPWQNRHLVCRKLQTLGIASSLGKSLMLECSASCNIIDSFFRASWKCYRDHTTWFT